MWNIAKKTKSFSADGGVVFGGGVPFRPVSEEKGAQQREGAGDPAAAGSGSLKRLVKGCGIRYNNLKGFCPEQKSGTLCVPQEPDGSSLRTLYHARLCSTKRRWIGSVEDRL